MIETFSPWVQETLSKACGDFEEVLRHLVVDRAAAGGPAQVEEPLELSRIVPCAPTHAPVLAAVGGIALTRIASTRARFRRRRA